MKGGIHKIKNINDDFIRYRKSYLQQFLLTKLNFT